MTAAVLSTDDFLGSLGVNIHLDPDDDGNAYDSTSTIVSSLSYLGVTNVRTQPYMPGEGGSYYYAAFSDMAQMGIKFDFAVGSSNSGLADYMSTLDALQKTFPGIVGAVEGPNEINYNPFTYDGLSGQPAAVAFQSSLYSAVRADPALAGVAIYDFTNGGAEDSTTPEPYGSGLSTYANIHVYPANGDQPSWYISANNTQVYGTTAVGPEVTTETGYDTDTAWQYGVSEDAQAKMTLNDLFDEAQAGISVDYLYELLDDNNDLANTSSSNHWGLFNADGTPKPVATDIHNLEGILHDDGPGASAFATASLPYSTSTLPYAGNSMELEKSNGAHDIILWDETPLWNPQTQTENSMASTPVTLSLGAACASIKIYDPLSGTAPVATALDTSTITVGLSDHPLVVEVSPDTVAPAAPVLTAQAPDQRLGASQAFSFALPAASYSDVQGGTLSFTASAPDGSALPSWVSFNPQNDTFAGTTPADSSALRIMVTATSSEGGISREAFSIYSSPPAPVLQTQQDDVRTPAGSSVAFTLPENSFSNPSSAGLSLNAMSPDGSALPSWLTFNQTADSFSGKVPDAAGGAYGVEVVATSQQGATAAEAFKIYGMPVAPTFLAQAHDQRLSAGTGFSFALPADSYADPGGGQVTYNARNVDTTALPSWLSFNAQTDTFTGTTPAGTGGIGVRIDATTPSGGTSAEAFHLFWGGANTSPDLAALSSAHG